MNFSYFIIFLLVNIVVFRFNVILINLNILIYFILLNHDKKILFWYKYIKLGCGVQTLYSKRS